MYFNTDMAIEKMKRNHENQNEGLECPCSHTTQQLLDWARADRQRVPLLVIEQKEPLGYSFIVHGDDWLTEFMTNLQINGVSEINRRAIKKTIKDEATKQIEDAASYWTKHDGGLGAKEERTARKLEALYAHLDEVRTLLLAQGEDEEAVDLAISMVLKNKLSAIG